VDRFSPEGVEIRFEAMLLHGERVIREVISKIPEGVYEAEDFLEISEGGRIKLSLEVKGDSLSFDFTGTDPESQTTSLNAVAQVTKSACYYAVRSLAPLDAPTNEGCYRPVHIALPRKSLVNASDPRAVSAGNVEVSQRITDVALKALSKALPDLIPAASSGTMNNITIGGYDSRRNRSYAYYETLAGGAGGGPRQAGRSGVHTHMTNTLNTPVEAIPLAYPFSIERYELRTGSGGRGKNPGGEGLVREYLFSEPATVTIISERRKLQPWGLAGGDDGASGVNRLIRANQEEYELAARETVQVDAGDRIVIETPGGGGFGPIVVN
jgi:N-methylhydantoinase B